jgi:hypothetical protein
LLSVGDIDGAAQLLPIILSSDLPESSRHLVLLRQACAENRVGDAQRMYKRGIEKFADQTSIMWLSHLIMGDTIAANETLMNFGSDGNIKGIADFLVYGTFDATPFPDLMELLETQGIERGEPVALRYQCKR